MRTTPTQTLNAAARMLHDTEKVLADPLISGSVMTLLVMKASHTEPQWSVGYAVSVNIWIMSCWVNSDKLDSTLPVAWKANCRYFRKKLATAEFGGKFPALASASHETILALNTVPYCISQGIPHCTLFEPKIFRSKSIVNNMAYLGVYKLRMHANMQRLKKTANID